MKTIDVFACYYEASASVNGRDRHAAAVKLTATSDAGEIVYEYSVSFFPHDDPEDAFEPAWARTKAMAAEFKKYIDVFLSIDPAPTAASSNGNIAVRTWRHKGDAYLLVVNCTTDAQTATVALSEKVGAVLSVDFGSAPKVDGKMVEVSLEPIGYRMVRFR